jgi:hypothetical protein
VWGLKLKNCSTLARWHQMNLLRKQQNCKTEKQISKPLVTNTETHGAVENAAAIARSMRAPKFFYFSFSGFGSKRGTFA